MTSLTFSLLFFTQAPPKPFIKSRKVSKYFPQLESLVVKEISPTHSFRDETQICFEMSLYWIDGSRQNKNISDRGPKMFRVSLNETFVQTYVGLSG
jgi:hypothetical protein